MKNFIAIWFLLSSFCFAQDRPVAVFDKDEELVRDLLSKLEDSMNNNSFRDYMACFTEECAKKNKKSASVMFVEHNLSLEFDNFQILESNKEEIEFVVKYTTHYSGESVITIANVLGKKENEDALLVANQEILSRKGNTRNLNQGNLNQAVVNLPEAMPEQECKDGMCRLKPVGEKIKDEDRKAFSLFNDSNGNPDPNGVMWLDPRTLMEVYPEQYECIGCR